MKSILTFIFSIICYMSLHAQVMTPELLWQLKRVSPIGITDDGESVLFNVSQYSIASNSRTSQTYIIPISGGSAREIANFDDIYTRL